MLLSLSVSCHVDQIITDLTFVDPHHDWEKCAEVYMHLILIASAGFNTFVCQHKFAFHLCEVDLSLLWLLNFGTHCSCVSGQ